jgi:membrane protease YdiL (CAAX protease family)
MIGTMETITAYFLRVLPGLVLGGMLLYLARNEAKLRIAIYLALFILFRDALTPMGLWTLGTDGFFWLRLYDDTGFLVAFGLMSILICLLLFFVDKDNRMLLRWIHSQPFHGILLGLLGAFLVISPFIYIYQDVPIAQRGGSIAIANLPAILVFAIFGNLLEEVLFRGYVLGLLMQKISVVRAGILSGAIFAFCHIFLAMTVTDVGYPLIIFTLWEGVIAGLVGAKYGILPAVFTHGGAIFLLSSGLF